MIVALHKPYGVLSRFTPDGSKHAPLATLGLPKDVYPVGRLDADSEGLLVLTDEPAVVDRLLDPARAHPREYWVEVERVPNDAALARLAQGVVVAGRTTKPARARLLDPQPVFAPRDPPVRFRKHVPTAWIALVLVEGKNRQVRRMTAAVGHPTLRLVRVRIGGLRMDELDLPPGAFRVLDEGHRARLLASVASAP